MRDVTIAVPGQSASFVVRDPPRGVDTLLADALAYDVPDAEYTDAYQHGWDGRKRLYDKSDHTAPVGLLDRAKRTLEGEGYTIDITTEGDRSGDPIDVRWHFEHDLRGYQSRAVADVLDAGGGVVSLPTGGGKTVVALKLIETIQQRTIVFVHTKELLYQWANRVRDTLDVDPGVIGDGEWSEGPVTIAIMQTLMSRGTDALDGEYGVAVFDECHRTSAAETMYDVGMAVDARWRVGLSATPWRKVEGEELKIEGAVGGLATTVSAEELISEGYLARPEFRLIDPAEYGDPATPTGGEQYHDAYERCIVTDDIRNQAVAETASDLARDGYTVLATVDHLDHGKALVSALDDDADVIATFLSGNDETERRQTVLGEFEDGDVDVLVSTLLKEGVDLPELNAIVLAEGGKSDIAKIQEIGRALRPANGDHAVIADVRDRGRWFGDHFEVRREAFADYYGEYGPEPPRDDGIEIVLAWLERNGFPPDKFDVSRVDGWVRIEKAGYIEEFGRFVEVMRTTSAVTYDGEYNYVPDPNRLAVSGRA